MKVKYVLDDKDIKLLNDSHLEGYINLCLSCK